MSAYREAMHEFAEMSNLEVWYSHLDMAGIVQRYERRRQSPRVLSGDPRLVLTDEQVDLRPYARLGRKTCPGRDTPLVVGFEVIDIGAIALHFLADRMANA